MFTIHRHSFFPFVVIVLSLVLAGFIYWSARSGSSTSSAIPIQQAPAVDEDAYQQELSQIVKAFDERLASSVDDLDTLLAAQTALAGMLSLRVPAEFKDLHLSLAVALSDIEKSLESGDRSIDAPLAAIQELREAYPWLAP